MRPTHLASIDIGGTKLSVTVASRSGPLVRIMQPTVKTGLPRAIVDQGLLLVERACEHAGIAIETLDRIGVSACGPFIRHEGRLALAPPNLCGGLAHGEDLPNDWTYIPLEQGLASRFAGIEIRNDCVAALIAERNFGAAQSETNVAYVTWSTGIGFGLCVDGHILHGKHGNAGHAGHMLLSEISEALCGCGNRGDLEALVAGRNLGNRLGRPLSEIFAAAQAGDPNALDLMQEAARWFGRGLYNLVATLDLDCLLVGGSVWRHHASLLAPLVEAEIRSHFPALTKDVTLKSAELDDLVADMGALALVMPAEWIADWRTRKPWTGLRSVVLA